MATSLPMLHFAHANGFPASSYRKLFGEIKDHCQVMALEKFAHNPQFPVSANWENQVEELVLHIKEQSDHPVYAVGHSFGAVISFMAVCRHPEYFRGLIMLDPPLVRGLTGYVAKAFQGTRIFDLITPAHKASTRCTQWPPGTDMVAYFQQKKLFSDFDLQCIEDYVSAATIENKKGVSLSFRHDVEADLFRHVPLNMKQFDGRLSVPALLITGEDTNVSRPAMMKPFLKRNPMPHRVLPKGGHMFPFEQPSATASLILEQLTEWESTR